MTDIIGGGVFHWEPGSPTDDTDMTLATAAAYRTTLEIPGYGTRQDLVHNATNRYIDWMISGPIDIGTTTSDALRRRLDGKKLSPRVRDSKANGSLMRTAPVALVRATDPDARALDAAHLSRITHPNSICVSACIAYCDLLASYLEGRAAGPDEPRPYAAPVSAALAEARRRNHLLTGPRGGYVLWSLKLAARTALTAPDFETGLRSIVEQGDDADTNGAIAGALLGARFGIQGIPARWVHAIQEGDTLADFARWAHDRNHQ